jgi:hypothetical protein
MKVHHLNCGTMNMPTAPMVCHVLVVETDNGLVLIDSGFGSHDGLHRAKRVGPTRHLIRPLFDHRETAAHQVERLGLRPDDVRHIVITHFDVDHIGGLSDFPSAKIHVTAAEALGAIRSPSWREKLRFRPAQWSHEPDIVEHHPAARSGADSPQSKNSTTSPPGWRSSRCRATPAVTRASPSTPATAGYCTAVTASTTTALSMACPACLAHSRPWNRSSRGT